jgi:hypothetical protein
MRCALCVNHKAPEHFLAFGFRGDLKRRNSLCDGIPGVEGMKIGEIDKDFSTNVESISENL